MSAIEIIEQIENLPSDEQAKVEAWFKEGRGFKHEVRYVSDEMFERAEDHVFQHYGSLLEELAK